MTNEEALFQMDSLMDNSRSFHEEKGDIWDKDIEALTLAKCAIQKQIPKKPTPHIIEPFEAPIKIGSVSLGDGLIVYECPDCKKWVSAPYRYCDNCGQALKWGDTE
ncbi:MAG: hypothetical protein ACI4FZ_02605 [Lachnospiraceae bacterium]